MVRLLRTKQHKYVEDPLSQSASRPPHVRSLASKFSGFTAALVLWIVVVVLCWDIRQHTFDWTKGLLLCCVGVSVRILALKALGGHFSAYVTLQPNHRLVQEGIYNRIRHPLYLSLLLAPSGIALVFASYLALPILALAMAFVLDRIRKEERLLAEHFGLEFEDYRRDTWQLIPLVL